MKMKIYLDDVRDPISSYDYMIYRIGDRREIYLQDWFVVKNYEQFVDTITQNYQNVTHVSFDYDLTNDPLITEDEKNGKVCAIWMKRFYKEHNFQLPIIYIHSMNWYGVQHIKSIFSDAIC